MNVLFILYDIFVSLDYCVMILLAMILIITMMMISFSKVFYRNFCEANNNDN